MEEGTGNGLHFHNLYALVAPVAQSFHCKSQPLTLVYNADNFPRKYFAGGNQWNSRWVEIDEFLADMPGGGLQGKPFRRLFHRQRNRHLRPGRLVDVTAG